MKTKTAIDFPATLRDLYSHPDFQPFGSTSDDWINDPERMERCNEAAEYGSDGSTHAEVIQDWRDFLSNLRRAATRCLFNHPRVETEIESRAEAIEAEIDSCEAWHAANGSLDSQIG